MKYRIGEMDDVYEHRTMLYGLVGNSVSEISKVYSGRINEEIWRLHHVFMGYLREQFSSSIIVRVIGSMVQCEVQDR